MQYKELTTFENHNIIVGEFFYGMQKPAQVKKIKLEQGDDGWDYAVYFEDGQLAHIPKSSVIIAVTL